MGSLNVPYPDAYAQEIADAYWKLCPPPEPAEGQAQISKAANVVRCLRGAIKAHVLEYRRRLTAEAAAGTIAQAETDLA